MSIFGRENKPHDDAPKLWTWQWSAHQAFIEPPSLVQAYRRPVAAFPLTNHEPCLAWRHRRCWLAGWPAGLTRL